MELLIVLMVSLACLAVCVFIGRKIDLAARDRIESARD